MTIAQPRRRPSRPLSLGAVKVGGGAPVSIQSMTNTDTRDATATLAQIAALAQAGCQIARVAVPDAAAASALPAIVAGSPLPVVADIHFDHSLALAAILSGVAGVRLNPGNIGGPDKVKAVAEAAGAAGIPIRVGANSGSLPADLRDAKGPEALADALVDAALRQCALLEGFGFRSIKVSLKASDVPATVLACRKFAAATDYPLHLGVTEAGTFFRSAIKSAAGIGALLLDGIGDTIRVSVTGSPLEEIKIALALLEAVGVRPGCPELVSCPTCGRTEVDLLGVAAAVEAEIDLLKAAGLKFRPSKVAVMGCAVNGPGEAKDADLGVAGAKDGQLVLFKDGRPLGVFAADAALAAFKAELLKLTIPDTTQP